jgi:hypothetical protein
MAAYGSGIMPDIVGIPSREGFSFPLFFFSFFLLTRGSQARLGKQKRDGSREGCSNNTVMQAGKKTCWIGILFYCLGGGRVVFDGLFCLQVQSDSPAIALPVAYYFSLCI